MFIILVYAILNILYFSQVISRLSKLDIKGGGLN